MTTLSAVVQSQDLLYLKGCGGSWESYSSIFFILLQEEPCLLCYLLEFPKDAQADRVVWGDLFVFFCAFHNYYFSSAPEATLGCALSFLRNSSKQSLEFLLFSQLAFLIPPLWCLHGIGWAPGAVSYALSWLSVEPGP